METCAKPYDHAASINICRPRRESLDSAGKDATEMGNKEPGRYIQCFVYVRASPDDNFYAHPLDVVVVVELQTKRVLQWWHHKANPIIPTLNSNFHTKLVDQERGWRTGLKPLNVVQPEGPSFSVDGNMVSWQKWSMRVSFNYREGLVLHTVGSVCAPQFFIRTGQDVQL